MQTLPTSHILALLAAVLLLLYALSRILPAPWNARVGRFLEGFLFGGMRERAAVRRAATCLGRGNWDGAIHEANRALQLDAENGTALMYRGQALFHQGLIPEALADYQRASLLRPRDAAVRTLLATACLRLGRLQEAVAAADAAVELRRNAQTLAARGDLLYSLGRREDARADFQAALGVNPANWVKMGMCDLAPGRWAFAIEAFDMALKLRRDRADAYYYRGLALWYSGSPNAALRDFTLCLQKEQNPHQRQAYDLGSLQAQGKHQEVMARTSDLLAQAPDNVGYLYLRCRSRLALGAGEKALEDAIRIRTVGWTYGGSMLEGASCIVLRRWPLAQEAYRRVQELIPECAEAWANSAWVHLRTEELDAAEEALNKALALSPTQPFILATRLELLLIRGELQQAVELGLRLLRLDDDYLPFPELLGQAYDRLGNREEAARHYRHFLDLSQRPQFELEPDLPTRITRVQQRLKDLNPG